MQVAKSFDTVTLKKMGHSALLLVAGALTAYLGENLVQFLTAFPIPDSWFPVTFAVATWCVNAVKEWIAGEK